MNKIDNLTFYFQAKDIVSATNMARNMPGVKHHKNNAIMSAVEVSYADYELGRNFSAYERRGY